jgi:hypothetical protein
MMHEPAAMDRPSIMQCLLQRMEHEARMRRARGPLAHDPAGIPTTMDYLPIGFVAKDFEYPPGSLIIL